MNLRSASNGPLTRPASPGLPAPPDAPADGQPPSGAAANALGQRDVLWSINQSLWPRRLDGAAVGIQRKAAVDAVSWAGTCRNTHESMAVLLTQIGWSLSLARLAAEIRPKGHAAQDSLRTALRCLQTVESAPVRFADRPGTADTAFMADALLLAAFAGGHGGHIAATAGMLLPLVEGPTQDGPDANTPASGWLTANAIAMAHRLLYANVERFDRFVEMLMPLLDDLAPPVQVVCLLDLAFLYRDHPNRGFDPTTRRPVLGGVRQRIDHLSTCFDPGLGGEYQRVLQLEAVINRLTSSEVRERLQALARPRPRWSVVDTAELIALCHRSDVGASHTDAAPAVACLLRQITAPGRRSAHAGLGFLIDELSTETAVMALSTLDPDALVQLGNALKAEIRSILLAGGAPDLRSGAGAWLFHCARRNTNAASVRLEWIKLLLLHVDQTDPDRDVLKQLYAAVLGG